MKIVFLLPSGTATPTGGFKIAYQYADGLAGRGHNVAVAHPSLLSSEPVDLATVLRRGSLSYLKNALMGSWRPRPWFRFRNNVKLLWVPALHPAFLPAADAYIATFWLTAEKLASWRSIKARKLYLIQHLETWAGPEQRVLATWCAGLTNVVIARWLQSIAHQHLQDANYIPNGLDFEAFGCDNPVEERDACRIAMLYHHSEWKGSSDGLAALKIARARVPGLTADLFGIPEAPPNLPEWIRYYRNPPQSELRSLYNRAAIFVSPSWFEGWPLPPAEAMMCGTAVVATDVGGHQEYCLDGETALLAPARQPPDMADRIIRLALDSEARIRLAKQGLRHISQFTWARALDSFERLIESESESTPRYSGRSGSI